MYKFISHVDARDEGLNYFMTKKPCVRKHIAPRCLSTGKCFACRDLLAERKKARDAITAKRRADLKEERKAKARAYSREYYLKNAPPKKPRVKVDRKVASKRAADKRELARQRATPSWSSIQPFFDTIDLTKIHEQSSDHGIPLQHPLVCGLNIPMNLERISRHKNYVKGNYFDANEWVYLKDELRFIRVVGVNAPDYGVD